MLRHGEMTGLRLYVSCQHGHDAASYAARSGNPAVLEYINEQLQRLAEPGVAASSDAQTSVQNTGAKTRRSEQAAEQAPSKKKSRRM